MAAEAEREAADPAGLGFAPDAPGAASGSDPAGTKTRKRGSNSEEPAQMRTQDSYLGLVGEHGLVKMPR